MHRSEEERLAQCADCGTAVQPEVERGFGFGAGRVLCFGCAQRRGGHWDELHDRWTREPQWADLAHAEE